MGEGEATVNHELSNVITKRGPLRRGCKLRMPFISVIIPTYNRLELLRETVNSVRSQTFTDFEIIVVNDGSTDGTAEWLAEQTDIKAINQQNQGIATSRNNGAAAAQGRWLAFLDHDDLWAPTKLEVQAEYVRANPDVALVAAKHIRLGTKPRHSASCAWIKGNLFVKAYSESFIHTSSVMIRRDVFDDIDGFPTRYKFADEFDVWLKISKAHPIAYVDQPLVFIRFYESNTSHNRVGVRTDTFDILMKNYDPDRISKAIFLRTLSDHDISFGRAYLKAGETADALKWFRKSVERTPFRMRSWRYYLRYLVKSRISRLIGRSE
jgi:glycosyltransferase involved in cell wall biosynthesis